ncbi:polyprenyl synthetase family protein [Nocardia sp. KC 131]|uniref:polyprenyl synthetase family protein n=1 Tax=Nocardia arseniciresistens TaxID=3392119 RepID=UPI00398EF459
MTTVPQTTVPDPNTTSILAAARAACDPLLRRVISELPQPMQLMAGYHFGWRDPQGRPIDERSGKGLRAALVFAVTAACRGDRAAAAPAAAAVELMHNFTLVHDDVMDADELRHGRATVWKVWGRDAALLLGDALHASAIRMVLDVPALAVGQAVARLEDAAIELCRGQFEDYAFESRKHVDIDEYLHMAMGKTGSLMGAACALGALCAGAGAGLVSAYDTFGRELGMAFQFTDDIIGITGDAAVIGKPVGSDLARRKRTLPVIAALQTGHRAAAELADLYASGKPLGAEDITYATELVTTTGGVHQTQKHADARMQAAIDALPTALATPELYALTRAITRRDR